MTLSITLVYLYMAFDYSMIVSMVFFMTAWIFTWYDHLSLGLPNSEEKICFLMRLRIQGN